MASPSNSPPSYPIPITLVTGFLGAGKTTLILNLIPQLRAANPTYKLALLKNEFGDLAVDSQLASSSAIAGTQEILGGCICCNLVGQLSSALAELRDTIHPDRIIVETSGSAFPATLALEVNRLARSTGGQFVLDGVVSVLDVENWKGYEDTSYTARLQAKYTDLVVFNKWENAGERRFDECLDRLGDMELDMAWVRSDGGKVAMELVFGLDGGLARAVGLTEEEAAVRREREEALVHEQEHGGEHHHEAHQSEVDVLSIELKAEDGTWGVDVDKLHALIRAAPKDEVYRIKAVLTVPATGPTVCGSDQEVAHAELPAESSEQRDRRRYILNWAFGRWTFAPLMHKEEHQSSAQGSALRMTMVLARHESTKWKKKLEGGGLLELEGGEKGRLEVRKIA